MPAKLRREVAQHTLENVRVVVHTNLVRNREKQCVRGRDRFVLGKFLDELVRLPGVRLAESSESAVQIPDLVLAVRRTTEVSTVQVADDREDASAHRDSRTVLVASGLPGVPEPLDLLRLELVERNAGVFSK